MANKRALTPADILPHADYARVRTDKRKQMTARKKLRRVEVGPHVTFYFENFDTMWQQVQEMLHIENGGAAQLADELAAYNPLIPNGAELVATFMIEIDDRELRQRVLSQLGGIEETAFLQVGGDKIFARPEADQDRTTAEGKASSVQFVHFALTPAQIAAFKTPGGSIVIGFSHPHYGHMAVLPEPVRAELAADFD